MPLTIIRIFLAIVISTAIAPYARSDVGEFMEYAALKRYAVAPGETTLSRGCRNSTCTVSRLGTRWGYLNRYETYKQRTTQSLPVTLSGCTSSEIGRWGDATTLSLGDCPDGRDNVWITLKEGGFVSLRVTQKQQTGWQELSLDSTLHVQHTNRDLNDIEAELKQNWSKKSLLEVSTPRGYITEPDELRLERIESPSIQEFRQAHARASTLWRTNPNRDSRPIDKAKRIVHNMDGMLLKLNWRELPDSELSRLNDIGFWLQQSDQCANAIDAVVILQHVLKRDPQRIPARLNLAEAQVRALAPDCKAVAGTSYATQAALRENLRQYCVAQGIEKIPANIATRIREQLAVNVLDSATCRPRGELFKAVQLHDAARLAIALQEHPEDMLEPSTSPAGNLVLLDAISENWPEGVRLLLEAGANPDTSLPAERSNEFETAPLVEAIYNNNEEIVKLLLRHKASTAVPNRRQQPIFVAARLEIDKAAQQQMTGIIQALLDAGSDVNQRDERGKTPLFHAVITGNAQTIETLLNNGADLNAVDNDGNTALFWVQTYGEEYTTVWNLLLQRGIAVNQQNRKGKTALYVRFGGSFTAQKIIAEMVDGALKYHANPELADSETGQVVLHRAAYAGNLPAVSSLLHAGAKRCPLDKNRKHPGDMAALHLGEISRSDYCQATPENCVSKADLQTIITELNCPTSQ